MNLRATFSMATVAGLLTVSASAFAANVARNADVVVTASSEKDNRGAYASNVRDGIVENSMSSEWVAFGNVGEWVQLSWPSPQVVDRIVLFDRQNDKSQVGAGTLQFSDGSSISVGVLTDLGGVGDEITFSARTITSVRFSIDAMVSGKNAGISEFEVYSAGASSGNQPPVVDAGIDQIAPQNMLVELIGAAASDPDGDSFSISWRQVYGVPVSLTRTTTLKPRFTTPSGLTAEQTLIFELRADDGTDVSTDAVSVTVRPASSGTAENISRRSDVAVTASSEKDNRGAYATNVRDGIVADQMSSEWVAFGNVGEWVQLQWPAPHTVDRVVLFDRQNLESQIGSATLSFSDGSSVSVGTLTDTGGTGDELTFAPRQVTSVRLIVNDMVSGKNAGLSEFEVYSAAGATGASAGCAVFPSVGLQSPETGHIQTSTTLRVEALACLDPVLHAGLSVKFTVDGGTEKLDTSAPYVQNFTNLVRAEHNVRVELVDQAGQPLGGLYSDASATRVGVGDYYVAIGDSITKGVGDDIVSADDYSADGRNGPVGDVVIPGGGFTPILNDLLTQALGYPHTVENEGVKGITSGGGLLRLPDVIAKHPGANWYLMKYGMNDANPLFPRPSGLGLSSGNPNYPGTYKANMQDMINLLKSAGKKIAVTKVNIALGYPGDPPSSNPDSIPFNTTIKEYNQVVDELVNAPSNQITITPPDLYNLFLNGLRYETEYADNLHPNGAGYQSMANEWKQALVPGP